MRSSNSDLVLITAGRTTARRLLGKLPGAGVWPQHGGENRVHDRGRRSIRALVYDGPVGQLFVNLFSERRSTSMRSKLVFSIAALAFIGLAATLVAQQPGRSRGGPGGPPGGGFGMFGGGGG